MAHIEARNVQFKDNTTSCLAVEVRKVVITLPGFDKEPRSRRKLKCREEIREKEIGTYTFDGYLTEEQIHAYLNKLPIQYD